MKAIRISGDARRRRAHEYMSVGDQMDAIAKGFRALQQQGFSLPAATQQWLDDCEAIKARLPKRPANNP